MCLKLSYTGILFHVNEIDKCYSLRLEQETPEEEVGRGEPLESFARDPGVVASVADLVSLTSTETQDNSGLGLL